MNYQPLRRHWQILRRTKEGVSRLIPCKRVVARALTDDSLVGHACPPSSARRARRREHHAAYIGWEEFVSNQEKIESNHNLRIEGGDARKGARCCRAWCCVDDAATG
jgi:hypothetical protein